MSSREIQVSRIAQISIRHNQRKTKNQKMVFETVVIHKPAMLRTCVPLTSSMIQPPVPSARRIFSDAIEATIASARQTASAVARFRKLRALATAEALFWR
jgi:hypothetical protein